MAKDTKEKIIDAALEVFSRDGYAGTGVREIAEYVGIVKSALYRHFGSKEEIWDAVYEMTSAYYEDHFGSAEKLPDIPKNTDELYEMTMRMINFTIHDEKIVKMRKILLTEQFRDEKTRKLASHYFIYDTEAIFTRVFDGMIHNGSLKEEDPGMLAFIYTAPITSLVHLCDREPEKEKEALDRIQKFIRHFINEYGIKQKQTGEKEI